LLEARPAFLCDLKIKPAAPLFVRAFFLLERCRRLVRAQWTGSPTPNVRKTMFGRRPAPPHPKTTEVFGFSRKNPHSIEEMPRSAGRSNSIHRYSVPIVQFIAGIHCKRFISWRGPSAGPSVRRLAFWRPTLRRAHTRVPNRGGHTGQVFFLVYVPRPTSVWRGRKGTTSKSSKFFSHRNSPIRFLANMFQNITFQSPSHFIGGGPTPGFF